MNALGSISSITTLSDFLMNNKNQTDSVPDFHASFHHRPIICRSCAGCREMQPCPQGKAERRFIASSWQHCTLAGSLAAFAKLQEVINSIKIKFWTLSNISDANRFQKLP